MRGANSFNRNLKLKMLKGRIFNSVLDTVGRTPVVRLNRIKAANNNSPTNQTPARDATGTGNSAAAMVAVQTRQRYSKRLLALVAVALFLLPRHEW